MVQNNFVSTMAQAVRLGYISIIPVCKDDN